MSSARKFGYSIIECGKGARMWKLDWTDAYKNVPICMTQLKYQGFFWCGMYFVETQLVFGSKHAVSAFDRLGGSVEHFAQVEVQFPQAFIHRTLDDLPFVTPKHSALGPEFLFVYKDLCRELGVQLAPTCPMHEKAFEDSTQGTVLGVRFNTESLTWSITESKARGILTRIQPIMAGQPAQLLQMQKLVGTLNDFAQMCPFLKGFRQPICDYLVQVEAVGDDNPVPVPIQVQTDLHVWAAAAETALLGLPIPARPLGPSLTAVHFTSDAAGAKFVKIAGRFVPVPNQEKRGAACLGHSPQGMVWFCSRITWPDSLMVKARDSKDHAYGCKSPTLEAIGILLPFVTIPHLMRRREVIMHTDNEAIAYGWESKRVKNDESAAIIIRAVHVIASFLECEVHIVHIPRMSTTMASLADRLTRGSTTGRAEMSAIAGSQSGSVPDELTSWLESPSEDWGLVNRLLLHVQERI
jgi:hypothetical protein